jgi:hypothetical protein
LNRRGFHAGAYALASCEVEVLRIRGRNPSYSVDAELVVADCGRIAMLDFSAHSEASAENALHKARLRRDIVVDFTAALETAVEDWREQQD